MTQKHRLVELLYFASCPGWESALDRVRQVLAESGLADHVSVRLVAVESEEQARRLDFLGSPTVRVDGRDVDPNAVGTDGALQCRLYEDGNALAGAPSVDLIRAALGVQPGGDRCR